MYTGCWQCRVRYWLSGPLLAHDAAIKWKHFPRNWSFVRGIHRWPVDSPHRGQWRGALMFSSISVSTNGWVNNLDAVDLRRRYAHYDVTVMHYGMFTGNSVVIRWIKVDGYVFPRNRKHGQDKRMISVALVTDTRFKPCIYIYIYIYIYIRTWSSWNTGHTGTVSLAIHATK